MNSNTEVKILIADDDQIIYDGLPSLLDSQDGLRVVATAKNGQKVFAQLQTHPVDLVLLDVDMSVMSGIEAARKPRLEYSDITIVMLTVFEHVGSLGQALGAGVHGFLTKDIPATEITKLVHRACNGQQVMGTRPIQVLTENYAQTQQGRKRYRGFIAAVDSLLKHLRPTFRLLLQVLTNKNIIRRLRLRDSTVRSYASDILEHTGCATRGELAVTAVRTGIRE